MPHDRGAGEAQPATRPATVAPSGQASATTAPDAIQQQAAIAAAVEAAIATQVTLQAKGVEYASTYSVGAVVTVLTAVIGLVVVLCRALRWSHDREVLRLARAPPAETPTMT